MIKDYIKQQVKENFRQCRGNGYDLPEYVEQEAKNDPNFFRFLFDEDFDEDFDGSLDEYQQEDFAEYLQELKDEFCKPINDLYDLAYHINMCSEYPSQKVEKVCDEKGWRVCDTEYEIAIDVKLNSILAFDENTGTAEVRYYKGGAREGSGKPSQYSGEKKAINLRLTVEAIDLLTAEAERTKISRSDIINKLIFDNLK